MLRFWVLREINSRFCSKTRWQMFLLVSGRHVDAHLGVHQHGVSIQISINLGKTFLRISSIRKIAVTWILARAFAYLPSFYFQILDLIYGTVLIFYFDLFWMAWHWKPAIVWSELYPALARCRCTLAVRSLGPFKLLEQISLTGCSAHSQHSNFRKPELNNGKSWTGYCNLEVSRPAQKLYIVPLYLAWNLRIKK